MNINEVKELFCNSPLQIFKPGREATISPEITVTYDHLANNYIKHPQNSTVIPHVLTALAAPHSLTLHSKCERLFYKLVEKMEPRQLSQHQDQVERVRVIFENRRQEILSSPTTQATLESAKRAKALEWKIIQEALQTAVSEIQVNFEMPLGSTQEYVRTRIERILQHLNKALNRSIDCKKLAEELSQDLVTMRSYFQNEFQALHMPECYSSHLDGLTDSELKDFHPQYQRLKQLCIQLKEFCENPGSVDASESVLFCKNQLQKILANSAYKLLCIDENQPCVSFAHHMAFALTTKPRLADAYSTFTQEMSAPDSTPSPFAQSLRETEKLLQQQMSGIDQFTDFPYPNKEIEIGSLNNGGQLFEEKNDRSITQVRLIGPGKIVNEKLDPTFPALLQSIENRIFHPKEDDPNPYYGFTLTNLQQFTLESEHSSALMQMQLQYRYPFSLRAITISAHAPFPIYQREKRTIEDTFSLLNLEYNFTLTQENKRCYYFPQQERPYWQETTSKIVELAKKAVNHIEDTGIQTGSFYQLVKIGLWIAHEEHSIKILLSEQKQLPTTAKVLHLCTCLAGVDRGGHSLAGRLWASGESDMNQKALDIFFGRAMLCEGRLPYEDHRMGLYRLTSSVSQKEANAFVNACRNLG